MPEFSTVDLDGETVTNDLFAEKDLTVLNVWGTFCGPCVAEMPELGEWAEELPENVQLVGLIIDIEGENDTEHRDAAVEITQKAGAEFRHLIANEDFAPFLEGVAGVPTTVFVDRKESWPVARSSARRWISIRNLWRALSVSDRWKIAAQCGVMAAAALMLLYGVSRGEVGVVFTKAVNICLECIGLG